MRTNALDWLRSLAQAAVCHAKEEHGWVLDHASLDMVDRILDVERSRGTAENLQALTLCYGAWLGQWAVSNIGGRWVGLSEPTPPRIAVNGVLTSPMDAVERRLTNDQSASMQSLVEQWPGWYDPTDLDDSIRTQNRSAWDARRMDPRFVRTDALPNNRDEALASIDPWLLGEGSIEGRRILCLAAGGGMHGPLLALAGANVTVVDFSDQQLTIDRQLANHYRLNIQTVNASIDDLAALASASFDAVVQPVSSCYVRELLKVYAEVARVLRPKGLYVAQHKQPTSLQATTLPSDKGYLVQSYADEGCELSPSNEKSSIRESEMTEFVHTWETLLGGLCRSGFVIEDFIEPPRSDAWAPLGSPEYRARFLPPYVKVKARRVAK